MLEQALDLSDDLQKKLEFFSSNRDRMILEQIPEDKAGKVVTIVSTLGMRMLDQVSKLSAGEGHGRENIGRAPK